MERKKILLADDVELFLMLEKSFLSRDEFDLITARNGREALTAIREMKPDLVFLDLFMPEMNGDDCCRIAKNNEESRHIPVVMVTTAGREEDLQRCLQAGCDAIVHKPINRHDFMAAARKLLQVKERGEQRVGVRLRVRYGTASHGLLSDFTINLSNGGLFLATNNLLPTDTPLRLEFILPASEKTIRCNARVAWVNDGKQLKKSSLPCGMGVQFLDLTLADLAAIRTYVENSNPEPAA